MNQKIEGSEKMRTNCIWALVLLLLVASSGYTASKKVTVDFSETTDFSKFKTFALSEKGMPFADEEAGAAVRMMLVAELETKGLREVELADADFYLVLFPSQKDGLKVDWYSIGYQPWWGPWGTTWGGTMGVSARTTDIKIGSMLVDIVDAGDEKLVWRGTIDLQWKDDAKDNIDNVMGVIESVFKNFPPK